jgi:hypothetical protein
MRFNDQFGVEAVERDGSDPDDDAPPDLNGDYHQSPVKILRIPTLKKMKTQATDPINAS